MTVLDSWLFKSKYFTSYLIALSCTMTTACSTLVSKETPTIAHTHIGHALTGWVDTPNRLGLLVVAEQEATIAAANAELLVESTQQNNLRNSKKHLLNIAHALDPETYPEGNGKGYGLRKATLGAISHLKFAAASPDASSNTLRNVTRTTIRANSALEKSDELLLLIKEAIEIDEIEVLVELAEDFRTLTSDIAGGPDKITPQAYGLFELRTDIEALVDGEDPPYSTVDSFYLFNLLRLPDGSWEFAKGRRRRGTTNY